MRRRRSSCCAGKLGLLAAGNDHQGWSKRHREGTPISLWSFKAEAVSYGEFKADTFAFKGESGRAAVKFLLNAERYRHLVIVMGSASVMPAGKGSTSGYNRRPDMLTLWLNDTN